MSVTAAVSAVSSAWDFSFTDITGNKMPLAKYEGQVLLVVNTASRCGFTPQYDALQALWETYKSDGLVVVGVPSDDFGGQELSSEAEVKQFCEVNFNIDFPLTEITNVKGGEAHPFYQWASQQMGMMAKPKWNFHKYLVDRQGQLVASFSSVTLPTSEKIRAAVETALTR
ncbi:MAG TPA: glutathione peroxidase [Alphaproteobacteria bacterium]|nr:glutathione peroxidase [Alphaproteobacteria bacterium]